ncbi:cilia- and flagella-associated protein 91-like [Ctenocephalides felis]|uniref:cilia- and flagella-associated protein 91-like n=1 Tax=Ctenocephalides felis TaxID=7515 RepID=UPI000E6E2A4B|nr:cilia- and flagella-associated protein 91-like [Ctenocephalides felis]
MTDPIFSVSGPRDHMKAAMTALMTSGEIGIHPSFRSMFSECPQYPRNKYGNLSNRYFRVRVQNESSDTKSIKAGVPQGSVLGPILPSLLFTSHIQHSQEIPSKEQPEPPRPYVKYFCNVEVQTVYRESSCQTHPWDPPYHVQPGTKPELLTLAWLAWKKGLPAGMNEIQLLHRARMRREWEEQIYLTATGSNDLNAKALLEEIEIEQYNFRAKEIEEIQEYRLQLVMEIYRKRKESFRSYHQRKLNEIWEKKKVYRNMKFVQIKRNADREFSTFDTMPDIAGFADPVSVYAEYAREVGVPINLWTDENLEIMQSEVVKVHSLSDNKKKHTTYCIDLLTKIVKPPHVACTPEVTRISDEDENEYQAIILLQKLLKGRAIHGFMFNGRATAMETITELRSTHNPLLSRVPSRRIVGKQKRFQLGYLQGVSKIRQPALFVEASSLGQMVDLLHKEVLRLEDEQSTYALRMLAKRMRWLREAREAGQRQKEESRRSEADFIYRMDNVKIHQDIIDLYLNDIIVDGIDKLSAQEAKDYVTHLALKLDETEREGLSSDLDDITMITECVHQFIAPEIEKQLIRDQLKQRQSKHIAVAHELVFSTMTDLQKFGFTGESCSKSSTFIETESSEALSIVRKIESEILKGSVDKPPENDLKLIKQIETELMKISSSSDDTDLMKVSSSSEEMELMKVSSSSEDNREFRTGPLSAIKEVDEDEITDSQTEDLSKTTTRSTDDTEYDTRS